MNDPNAGECDSRSFAPSNCSSGELDPEEDADVDAEGVSFVPSVEGGCCGCWDETGAGVDLGAFKGDVTPFPDPGVN